jgi:hypothetical protein
MSCKAQENADVNRRPVESDFAILLMESKDVKDNFTDYQNGLKLTYDFWGEAVVVLLENISDSILFIDLENSEITIGLQSLKYDVMLKGDSGTFALLPDSIVELNNFRHINKDTDGKILYEVNELLSHQYRQKAYEKNESPIIVTNLIRFSVYNENLSSYSISNTFYASVLNLISEKEFYALKQSDNRLYNKAYLNLSNSRERARNRIDWTDESKEIFIEVLYSVLEIAFLILLEY